MVDSNEPQKVAEWLTSLGFGKNEAGTLWCKNPDRYSDESPLFIDDDTATFFYRAVHPEPVADGKYTNKENEFYVALEDAVYRQGMDLRMIAKKMIEDRQRILDRVERKCKADGLLGHDLEILLTTLDQIQKEEL